MLRGQPRSRGPSGPPQSGESGNDTAPQERCDPLLVAKAIWGALARATRREAAKAGIGPQTLSRGPITY